MPQPQRPSPTLAGVIRWLTRGLAVLATVTMVACGGGGGDAAPAPADAFFSTAVPFGGTGLPPGAQQVAVDAFKAWAGSDMLVYVTAAEATTAARTQQAREAEDEALVAAAAARNPRIARLLAMPTASNESITVHADGTRSLRLTGSERPVVLDGPRQLVADIAASLRTTNARPNVEAAYASLYDMLPLDQRDGLPEAASLASVSDADLQRARGTLVRRLEHLLPAEDTPAVPPAVAAALGSTPGGGTAATARARALGERRLADTLEGFSAVTQCESQPGGEATHQQWALKGHITPIRNQGSRGTCSAHAIVAGIETWVSRHRGRLLDLSEQEVYAAAKHEWFRVANDFGDGLPTLNVMTELKSRGLRLDNESAWRYNRSSDRMEVPATSSYLLSCQGYEGTCSDTNHQRELKCTSVAGVTYCAYKAPSSVTQPGSDNQRLTGLVSLWDETAPLDSLAAIRAMVAGGKPVVISVMVDSRMRFGAENASIAPAPGFVNFDESADLGGAHAMLVVGHLPNSALPADRHDAGGGYLVVKNSWGCMGDQGHLYLGYSWLVERLHAAVAVTGVASAVSPLFSLAVSKAVVKDPTDLRFTISGNVRATKVSLYLPGATEPFRTLRPAEGETFVPNPLTAGIFASTFIGDMVEGKNFVIAVVHDEGGTPLTTNWVSFMKDTLPPVVSLAASATTMSAPGTLTLTAEASDASGIQKVEFFRGMARIGTVTAPPYRLNHPVAANDLGTAPYIALATDGAGRLRLSNVVHVNSVGVPRPLIGGFTATPDALGNGGGPVTLTWSTLSASSVTIEPGLGAQPAAGSASVNVTAPTTFTLSATNAAGTTSQQLFVNVQTIAPPIVSDFSASPQLLPIGGGSTTLNWTLAGTADSVSISPLLGSVTGQSSKTLNLVTTTTFTLTASNAGGSRSKQVTVTVVEDTSPPTVSLAASPTALAAAGSVTLTAPASDAGGIARVEFYRGSTLLGQDTSAPYSISVPLGAADNGTVAFTAKAIDLAGNVATSSAAEVQVAIPAVDVTLPIVTLAASSQNVTAPGSTTLQATASDNVGIARVEFHLNGVVQRQRTAPPYEATFSFTTAQTGNHSYTAVAFDAAGNSTVSAPVVVTVALPVGADRYVDPVAGNDANDGLSAATAYRTLTRGLAQAVAGGTVWLANGSYAPENSPPSPSWKPVVPVNVTVRALSDGGATLGYGLAFAGHGAAQGLAFAGPAVKTAMNGIEATTGTVNLRNLRFANLGSASAGGGGFGANGALNVHGDAKVTLTTDDPAAVVFGAGIENGALVHETGELKLQGGRAVPSGACSADACVGQIKVGQNAILSAFDLKVELNDSTSNAPQPWLLVNGSGYAGLNNSSFTQAGTGKRDLAIVNDTGTVFVLQSTVGSSFHNVVGLQSGSPRVTFQGSTVNGSVTGRVVGPTYFATTSTPTVQLVNSTFSGFSGSGAVLDLSSGGQVHVASSTFLNNRNAIRLGGAASVYDVRIMLSSFSNDGGCARPTCAAVSLQGAAGSVFHLGTAAEPGANSFVAATASTALVVKPAAGVQVSAVGNAWAPGVQGASASGTYALGSTPCGTAACTVTSGNGQNYVVTSGGLKLAGP